MRIIQLFYYPGQGGAEEYAYLLAKSALKDGHTVEFIFSEDGPLVERIKKMGCPFRFIKMRSPFDPLAIKDLATIFKEERPDIVQTHFLRENFLAVSASKLAPVGAIFSTVHRIEPKTSLQKRANRFYSKGLDKFIAVSDLVKEYLIEEGIKESKIVVIPCGVEIGRFSRSKIKKELGLKKNEKYLACVGRFTAEKDQEGLIKALAKIKDKKIKLVLVGEGELKAKVEKLAEKIAPGQVIFTGGREKAYEITGSSTLYVQPSKVETFGMGVVEAMLQKVPFVASNIPAFALLSKNGSQGTLYKYGKVNEFAEKIDQALKDRNAKKINAAYKFAKARYTREIMWTKTSALYQHTLDISALKKSAKRV